MSLIPTTRGLKIGYEDFKAKRASSSRHSWTVFLASYQGMATTRSRVERLRKLGFSAFEASSYHTDGIQWYRLMVGRVSDRSQAVNLANKLKEAGEPYIKVLNLPFALEVSAYDSHDSAIGETKKLREARLAPYIIETISKEGEARYTVYLGAFTRSEEAGDNLKRLSSVIPDLRITTP
jgi:cell division septation protein DedD